MSSGLFIILLFVVVFEHKDNFVLYKNYSWYGDFVIDWSKTKNMFGYDHYI